MHFVDNVHVIKDNLFTVPPLFKLIQENSKTDWKEMYQVFNCGHRMELYVPQDIAQEIIAISESYGVAAQIVGRVEAPEKPKSKEEVASLPTLDEKLPMDGEVNNEVIDDLIVLDDYGKEPEKPSRKRKRERESSSDEPTAKRAKDSASNATSEDIIMLDD